MKVTINGSVSEDALKVVLASQKKKVNTITAFCKSEGLKNLFYKDSELEFEYTSETHQASPRKPKVEVRTRD